MFFTSAYYIRPTVQPHKATRCITQPVALCVFFQNSLTYSILKIQTVFSLDIDNFIVEILKKFLNINGVSMTFPLHNFFVSSIFFAFTSVLPWWPRCDLTNNFLINKSQLGLKNWANIFRMMLEYDVSKFLTFLVCSSVHPFFF